MSIFGVCLGVLLVAIVGSAWLPRPWINPFFLLFTTAVTWLATTMLYVGFIFGNWEINSLTNVIEELELRKLQTQRRESSQDNSAGSQAIPH
jgi:sphingomyelin phosphodiesterase 2